MPRNSSSIRIKTKLKISKGWPDFTPFVGVFFLLLVFFLMGSSFVQVSGIPVELPQTHSSSSFGVEKSVVTIDRQGKIFFNDLAIPSLDILKEKLLEKASTERAGASSTATVVVRADSRSSFGAVAKIMALAEELKINAFVLTVPPAAREERSEFMDKEK